MAILTAFGGAHHAARWRASRDDGTRIPTELSCAPRFRAVGILVSKAAGGGLETGVAVWLVHTECPAGTA